MNNERLLKLADLLEADAAKPDGIKFNMHVVISPAEEANNWPVGSVVKLDCGTQGCAMGLAALSGQFPGLSYSVTEFGIETVLNGEWVDFDHAACEVFDLEEHEADFLFLPGKYCEAVGAAAEREVATRIRDLVAGIVPAPCGGDEDLWEDD